MRYGWVRLHAKRFGCPFSEQSAWRSGSLLRMRQTAQEFSMNGCFTQRGWTRLIPPMLAAGCGAAFEEPISPDVVWEQDSSPTLNLLVAPEMPRNGLPVDALSGNATLLETVAHITLTDQDFRAKADVIARSLVGPHAEDL